MRSEISWRMWSLADSLLGAAVGASFLYGVAAIYLRARGVEGMGFGDVKLMAMIGAFLGTQLTVLTIFSASLAGSLFGLSTVLAVWIKRTSPDRGAPRFGRFFEHLFAHFFKRCPAARLAIGSPRAPLLRDAVWRVSRQHGAVGPSCLETASCTGIGGRCEPADESDSESDGVAHGPLLFAAVAAFGLGLFADSAPAEESRAGARIAESTLR